MQSLYYLSIVLVFSFSPAKVDKACEYAGSNLNYVNAQTKRAIAVDDMHQARFFAYKALKAIENSKDHLKACGCEYANENIAKGLNNLKLATRASTLSSTRILLHKAMEYTLGGVESLEGHDLHNNRYASDVLVMNTISSNKEKTLFKQMTKEDFESKIDRSLEKYRISLDKVVTSVDCQEAKAFAKQIYDHCEQELMRDDLPESKYYYNLRTKDITAKALAKMEDCQ